MKKNEINVRNKVSTEDLESVKQWIKDNISSKNENKLPSETEIDNNNQILPDLKHRVKKALWKKKVELTPIDAPTGKIKKHLMENMYKWKNWEYLDNVEGGEEDDEDSWLLTKMFNESFGKTVAKEMLPKIETAIKTNTIEGYKKLDEEWGEKKLDKEGKIEFNFERDYFGAWYTLKDYLKEAKTSKEVSEYEQLKKYLINNYLGEKGWKQMENEMKLKSQITTKDK